MVRIFPLISRANYLEIYNEKIYDLLNNRAELKIKELPNGELNIGEGEYVRSEDEILKLVDRGNLHRKVAETNMNVQSSRSHAILQIVSYISRKPTLRSHNLIRFAQISIHIMVNFKLFSIRFYRTFSQL